MSNSPSSSLFGLDTAENVLDLQSWPATNERGSPSRKIHRTLAPNLIRRSHKKSRGGCFSCKSRKIKCQETRPSCENCILKELECGYPSNTGRKITRRSSCASTLKTALVENGGPKLAPSLSPPTSFSMDDMRFFHHFLTVAYPHLPLGNDSVWVQDIPVFAQQHEYLMHALLALGASHLTRVSRQDHSTVAIVHRGRAIKGLNDALAKGTRAYGEADALLAACYALTFQASYMGDGLADFITMVRGCALVTMQIKSEQCPTAFNLETDMHIRLMAPILDDLPTPDPSLVTPAVISVEALRPLLRTSMDQIFHAGILAVLVALQESPKAGYMNFIRIYGTLFDMTHDQFRVFVDTANIPSQLLMAHFIALQILMVPLTARETRHRADPSMAKLLLGTVEWGEKIFQRAPADVAAFLEWPRTIMETVRREVEALNADSPRSIMFRILID